MLHELKFIIMGHVIQLHIVPSVDMSGVSHAANDAVQIIFAAHLRSDLCFHLNFEKCYCNIRRKRCVQMQDFKVCF